MTVNPNRAKLVLFDCETNGFDYTEMLCIAVKAHYIGGTNFNKTVLFDNVPDFEAWADKWTDANTLWVAHNGCGFDYWAVNDLTNVYIPRNRILDTSVLTKLYRYNMFHTHSLAEIGYSLGVIKADYTGGFEEYTKEMGEYCVQDVEVLHTIWTWIIKHIEPLCPASVLEHDIALICAEMQRNGFPFNVVKARELLQEVEAEMSHLEAEMRKEWPDELVEDRTIKWREKPDGTPYATCLKAMADAPKWRRDGDDLVLYKWKSFNPGSSKDRVDKLWDAGWQPYDKTKGHIMHEREKRKPHWR